MSANNIGIHIVKEKNKLVMSIASFSPQIVGEKNTVSLITPESIHVNAFIHEPLIDISNWKLFELYSEVCSELI